MIGRDASKLESQADVEHTHGLAEGWNAADEESLASNLDTLATQAAFVPPAYHMKPAPGVKLVSGYKADDLLSLLHKPAPPTRDVAKVMNDGAPTSAQEQSREDARSAQLSVLQPVTAARMDEISTRLDIKANVLYSQPSTASERSSQIDTSRRKAEPRNLKPSLTWPASSLPHNDGEVNTRTDEKQQSQRLPSNVPQSEALAPSMMNRSTITNSFQGLKRVPRSFVRIPKTQRALLDRDDSWVQSELKDRVCYPNIPSDVLESLRLFTKRTAPQKQNSHKDESVVSAYHSDKVANHLSMDQREDNSDEGSDEGGASPRRDLPASRIDAINSEACGHAGNPNDGEELDGAVSWCCSSSYEAVSLPIKQLYDPESMPESSIDVETGFDKQIRNHTRGDLKHQPVPYEFPSSSPNSDDEDKFEIDVPHAIGEIVEDDLEVHESQETSQELPSTAVQNHPVVEVEQTPYPNHRITKESATKRGYLASQVYQFGRGQHIDEDISSDPIIPATFNEMGSQLHSLNGGHSHPLSSLNRSADIEGGDTSLEVGEASSHSQRSKRVEQSSLFVENAVTHQGERNDPRSSNEGRVSPLKQQRTPSMLTSSPVLGSPIQPQITQSREYSPGSKPLKRDLQALSPNDDQRRATKRAKFIPSPELSQTVYTVKDNSKVAATAKSAFMAQLEAAQTKEQQISSGRVQPSPNLPEGTSTRHTNAVIEIPDDIEEPKSLGGGIVLETATYEAPQLPSSPTPAMLPIEEDTMMAEADEVVAPPSPNVELEPIPTAFDTFQSAYPSYEGSEKQFIHALTYLDWLGGDRKQKKKFLLKSLWDDFIRALSAEYMEYIRDVRDRGTIIMTGLAFYIDQDKEPLFKKRIITPNNLQETLASLDDIEIDKWKKKFGERKVGQVGGSVSTPHPSAARNSFGGEDDYQDGETNETSIIREKTPFFETLSQVLTAKRTETNGLEVQVDQTPKTGRRLPWAKTQMPQATSTMIPKSTERALQSTPRRPTQDSPNRRRVSESHLSLHCPVPMSRPSNNRVASLSNLKSRTANIPTSTNVSTPPRDEAHRRVEGWLADPRVSPAPSPAPRGRATLKSKPSFKEFLRKRKETGKLVSRTTQEGVCTKPLVHDEPQTQAWNYGKE